MSCPATLAGMPSILFIYLDVGKQEDCQKVLYCLLTLKDMGQIVGKQKNQNPEISHLEKDSQNKVPLKTQEECPCNGISMIILTKNSNSLLLLF